MSQTSPPDYRSLLKNAALELRDLRNRLTALETAQSEPIAIVGLGCRLPGGVRDAESFWQLLRDGIDAIQEFPPDRWDINALYDPDPEKPGRTYSKWGGFIEGIDGFDPGFFGISAREAMSMDPQQRLLLEVVWEALENAGQAPDRLLGSQTGVFIGVAPSDYMQQRRTTNRLDGIDAYLGTGNALSVAAGRLSYVLGLQGPALSVDTACSSSLVALHLACQSLHRDECRMALAGGVNLLVAPEVSVIFSKARMLALDGRCKTFDAAADGYVRGEGCGIVVLKRLSAAEADGDRILAIVKGSAVNQDGRSGGLTAPNGPAQEAVIRRALQDARIAPAEVGYVEAHGTGTALGDPIEVQALANVLREGRPADRPVYIGSVKTNLGHLEVAAGIAGLIKAVLAVAHGEIPPHLHFHTPSPHIPWRELPVAVPTRLTPWPVGVRRIAGVSSFGFSGTNAHIVLEEAPQATISPPHGRGPQGRLLAPDSAEGGGETDPAGASERSCHLLALSAKSEHALLELAGRFAGHLGAHRDQRLADVCFSANTGRAHFAHRLAVMARDADQARERLEAFRAGQRPDGLFSGRIAAERPRVAFLFSGQGAQYVGMGRGLYETQPAFRAALDQCDAILRPLLPKPLLEVMFGGAAVPADGTGALGRTLYTQPALFALEYALAQLWRAFGIEPAAVLGHSVGEYVAACVAGVFTLEDGLTLIAERARLMDALPSGGRMAAVFADVATVRQALVGYDSQVSIAAVNGPAEVAISGTGEAVGTLVAELEARGIGSRSLEVSHAFHSPLLEPMLDALESAAARAVAGPARIPLVSNLTGQVIRGEAPGARYWRRHAREAVEFQACMETLSEQAIDVYLEIGPGSTLLGMGRRCLPGGGARWLPSLHRGQADEVRVLETLSGLYVHGVKLDFAGFDRPWRRKRLELPTYPFQRHRYWISDLDGDAVAAPAPVARTHALPGIQLPSPLEVRTFETWLEARHAAYFTEHRLLGSTVLPASYWIAMGLACDQNVPGEGGLMLEELTLHTALVLGDARQRVQLILRPIDSDSTGFQVYSHAPEGEPATGWTLHASGRLRRTLEPRPQLGGGLAALRARLPERLDGAALYTTLAAHGLELGPGLQGVREVFRGQGEALARLELPSGLEAGPDTLELHPALIDAALQVFAAAVPAEPGVVRMPAGIERILFYDRSLPAGWSHVRSRPGQAGDADPLLLDITLLDPDGNAVLVLEGFAARRLRLDLLSGPPADPRPRAGRYYELRWKPSPRLPALPVPERLAGPAAIADQLRSSVDALRAGPRLESFQALIEHVDRLCASWAAAALVGLGIRLEPGNRIALEALDATGVIDRYRRLLRRLLGMLEEEGVLERDGEGWTVRRAPDPTDMTTLRAALLERYPSNRGELTLLERCGTRLLEVMRGDLEAGQLLFTDEALRALESLYQDSPFTGMVNTLLTEAIATALAQVPADRPLRILEIGGGTGATTAHLLPVLANRHVEYTFTDVSPQFTARAERKFAGSTGLRFGLLDIERAPDAQGFPLHHFDLIIAANVLHATRDLRVSLRHVRRLLVPGGLLAMIEGTGGQRSSDLIVGLTEGWWRFEDLELRPSYPLLPIERWQPLLQQCGFSESEALVDRDTARRLGNLTVLLARASDPTPQDPGEAARTWLIFMDQGGTGAELARRLEARGDRVIQAVSGEAHDSDARAHWTINPLESRDFDRVIDTAGGSGRLAGVVYLWGLDGPAGERVSPLELERAMAVVAGGALRLIQALIRLERGAPRLWVVTRSLWRLEPGGEPRVPVASTVWGLGRTLSIEHPQLWGGALDLEACDPVLDAARVLGELDGPYGEEQVAWRDGLRQVARLARSSIPQDILFTLHGDASYLITGGLGGLGLEVAAWMVERGARHLVLVGRHGAGTEQLARIEALRTRGADVLIEAVDVSQADQVAGLMARIRVRMPPLRGVMHAAGVFDDGMLSTLGWGQLERVLAPKAVGAWNLHLHTLELPLDFFVLFSSSSTLVGAPGIANYVAANAFLDALAIYRRSIGLPGVAIDWGPWDRLGMALAVADVQETRWRDLGVTPLTRDQGMAGLEAALAGDAGRLAVLEVDWQPHLQQGLTTPLLEDLLNEERAAYLARGAFASLPDAAPGLTIERLLEATPEARQRLLLAFVRAQVARIVRADEETLDTDLNLVELGMDSLMVMDVLAAIRRTLGLVMYPRELYAHPTVRRLSRYLSEQLELARARAAVTDQGRTEARAVADQGRTEARAVAEAMLDEAGRGSSGTPEVLTHRNPPMVFLLSTPRSGSTLVRVMLAGHPALFSPPELHLLPFRTMRERQAQLSGSHLGEGLQRALMELLQIDATGSEAKVEEWLAADAPVQEVYGLLQSWAGTRLLVDKSPSYVASLDVLRRAERLFEGARYIHLVRHPYAVLESYVRMRMDRLLGSGDADPFALAEALWTRGNRNVVALLRDVDPGRQLLVRYEAMVREPRRELERVCDFLGLPFDEAMLTPYEGRRMLDGLHPQSIPLNDPNFLARDHIDATLADAWKTIRLPSPLGRDACEVARALGYALPIEDQGTQPTGERVEEQGAPPAAMPVEERGRASAVPSFPAVPSLHPERRSPLEGMDEHSVGARGLELRVCTWGDHRAPTVVCVHGLLEQGASWVEVAKPLMIGGYRVLAPDQRGHGCSSHAGPGGAYHFPDLVADLDAVVRALAPQPVVLVGHSMGAMVAAAYAAARPSRVRSLVMVESFIPAETHEIDPVQSLETYLDYLAAPLAHPVFADVEVAADRLRAGSPSLTRALARALAERLTMPCEGGVQWRWDPLLRTRAGLNGPAGRERYLELLRRIQAPLTLVYGARSDFTRLEQGDPALIGLPGVRRVVLDGAHNLQFDGPEHLAAVIMDAGVR